MRIRLTLIAAVMAVTVLVAGCIPIAVSTTVAARKDQELQRETGAAQAAIIKANAARTGYEMPVEQMEKFSLSVFQVLEVQPTECWTDYEGIAYCGVFLPKYDDWLEEEPKLRGTFAEQFPEDVNGALPLVPWTKGDGHHWRSYVIEGMQVVRFLRWSEHRESRIAIVFEEPQLNP